MELERKLAIIACRIVSVLSFCTALGLAFDADAFLHAGGGLAASGSPSLITTMQLANNTGSSISASSLTPMFGQAFKKGDLPNGCSGSAPIFKLPDGTVVPFSESTVPICWSDGSLKFAAFIARDPESIAANSQVQVSVYSGGTTPSPSGRSLCDFTAGGLDLNSQVVGLDSQLSGTWESELSQAIGTCASGSYDYKYLDGAAGTAWRITADYRQSGASHGQLENFWYVIALQDSGGNLAGVRYLNRLTAPWYNVASPAANFWSFSSYKDYNGATLVKDLWGTQGNSFSFSWSSGVTFSGTLPTNAQTGNLIRVSSLSGFTGGLSTGTSYFIKNGTGGTYNGSSFNIGPNSSFTNVITPTGSGGSTGTGQLYPYIAQFGSLFDAQSNGRYNYIQGNGSIAADPLIQVIPNNTYLRSTRLIPPYAFGAYSITDRAAVNFSPMTGGPFYRDVGSTGERDDIGPFNAWQAVYLFNETANDEITLRTMGLVAGQFPANFRDATTKAIPALDGNTYIAMTTASTTIRWDASSPDSTGFTLPATVAVWNQGFNELTTDHFPQMDFPAFLVTGEPQYMDMLEELANEAILARATQSGTASVTAPYVSVGCNSSGQCNTGSAYRNNTINGTTYHAFMFGSIDALRADAWAWRAVAAGSFLHSPENASYHTYFDSVTTNSMAGVTAYLNMFSPSAWNIVNGLWSETSTNEGGVESSWATGYLVGTLNLSVNWTEDGANLTNFINFNNKWFAHLNNTFGTSWVGNYQAMVRQSTNNRVSPFVTSDANVGFQGLGLSWSSGNSTFTYGSTCTCSNYTPANGDYIMFNDSGVGSSSQPPAGLTGETPYFFVNVNTSAKTLQLSTTYPTQTIQTPTNNGSHANDGNYYFYSATGIVPPYGNTSVNSADGYSTNILAEMNFSKALGLTVDATTLTNLNSLISSQSGYPGFYQTNPKYLFQSSF